MMAPPIVERFAGFAVVRDDLVPGGTKRRALPALLDGPAREHVYASSAYGYAQVALAYACAAGGHRATIFTAARRAWHRHTLAAQAAGAHIVPVAPGYLSHCESAARRYAAQAGAHLVPFGMDDPAFIAALAAVARDVAAQTGDVPEVWTVAGSGVLTRALQQAWPRAAFHAVQVGHKLDQRAVGRARLWVAPERFDSDAAQAPPFPSCANYDAKAWRFIRREARPGALFWNVAA